MEATICSTAITGSHVSDDVHSIINHMISQMLSSPTEPGLHSCICICVSLAFVFLYTQEGRTLFKINSVYKECCADDEQGSSTGYERK